MPALEDCSRICFWWWVTRGARGCYHRWLLPPPSCCYSLRCRFVGPTPTSKMVCNILFFSCLYFSRFNIRQAVRVISHTSLWFERSHRAADWDCVFYAFNDTENGLIYWLATISMLCVFLCLSVFAINGLYTALGAPQLPNWTSNGGDPCNENWQGVSCVASNITSMYDQCLCFFSWSISTQWALLVNWTM